MKKISICDHDLMLNYKEGALSSHITQNNAWRRQVKTIDFKANKSIGA